MAETREKVREYYNRSYEAHRDEVNSRAAARRDADPERRADLQRNRSSDPEVYRAALEAKSAARRLERSLSRAGFPPKLLHATTAAERRADEREADAYFNDPSRKADRRCRGPRDGL
ncbi:hypothetical protein [Cryobacterium ruanii]|uniref:Uncharacterized protein n=1 Tax=Cryobacterium ruanii TaxID=1259197 RepID=A0A4V3ITB0_9MICO|nr:hypothetical protein [Cryobacterium ruanii]TFD65420.1 hypothetical protein E3T47_11465 [Cryobacterium ruanii]